MLQIQVLAWDRHKSVAGLMESQIYVDFIAVEVFRGSNKLYFRKKIVHMVRIKINVTNKLININVYDILLLFFVSFYNQMCLFVY